MIIVFLVQQGQELRRALAENTQRHYQVLLETAAGSVKQRLREKETEVQKAVRRKAEPEARAAQLNSEVQKWQAKAREQEATATALQAMISAGSGEGQGNGKECAAA